MTKTDARSTRAATLTLAAISLLAIAACGGGGSVPRGGSLSDLSVEAQRQAAGPEALHRAAGASPAFGSVSQSSNVRDGVSTDRVTIAYVRDGETLHPVTTIRPGDGAPLLRSNTDPRIVDVQLPAGRIFQMADTGTDQGDVTSAEIEQLYTRADWKAAEEELFRILVEEHGEARAREYFVSQYGSYPIPDSVPYNSAARPFGWRSFEQWVSPPRIRRHPKGRTVNEVYLVDILDDTVRGPGLYTVVFVAAETDYPASVADGADDYLTWGSWYYFTTSPTGLDLSGGAFADGVETTASAIPVSGTASYVGLTQATAIKGGAPSRGDLDDTSYWNERVAYLRGDVTLQADFASGTVTGTVDGLRSFALQGSDEPATYFPGLTVDLGTAQIEAGTFKGDAHATSGLAGATGKWGGQFFGTPDAGAVPPASGGTWGVTQGMGDSDWKVIGGFASWRE